MKQRLLATMAFLCIAIFSQAQYVTIPDYTFAMWLQNNGYINCLIGDQLDTTCYEVVNATNIDCRNSNINDIDGIQYFDNVTDLMVEGNNLTSITALPPMLTGFYCDGNHLTSLPPLPATLTYLDCCRNNFTTLPSLPAGLVHLFCHEGSLNQLPALPATLQTLECYTNNLTFLPAFPSKLRYVDLHSNQISALPALGDSIRHLNVYGNQLTSVTALSPYLEYFDVTLNQLTSLPALPMYLKTLQCSDNQLTALPNFPSTLRDIGCGTNQLTSLPQLPDTVSWLYCSGNANLACLPTLTRIGDLNFDNTAVTCVPNYGSVGQSSPSLGSLPLCDLYNGAGCETYWNVLGKTFLDVNNDCIYNNSDAGRSGVKLNLWSGGVLKAQALTNSNGDYSFRVMENGNYEIRIDTVGLPFYVLCPAGLVRYVTVTSVDSVHYLNDFSLRCKPGVDLVVRDIGANAIFRPANNTPVRIYAGALESFYGANCTQGVAATVQVTISGPGAYLAPAAGAIAPSSVSGNVLTWNVADLGNTNVTADFNIIIRTDTFAQIGQQVCFAVKITPATGSDRDTTNNRLNHCFSIVNSYDPNDKTAYPNGDIDTAQEWLTYRVRFQNTGNADAQHIYIADTLDSYIDASSFQLLSYSHRPIMEIAGSILKFNFPYINLPDSFSNEPGSHGYVQYKVKLKENLPIGAVIENTAHIYFDFNTPVITNTATNTITEDAPAANTAPSAVNDIFSVNQGSAAAYNLTANDIDADNDVLCITNLWGSAYASKYSPDSCSHSAYAPHTSFIGADTLYYSICDNGQPVLCDTGLVVFTVAQNLALYPVASDDALTLTYGADSTINVIANDVAGSTNNAFCITGIQGSSNFSIVGCGTVAFDADSTFAGTDSCMYIVCDNSETTLCDTAMLSVTVQPRLALQAPVAQFELGQVCDYIVLYNTSTNYNSSTWAIHDFSTTQDTTYTNVDTLELQNGTMVSVCLTVSNVDSSATYCDTLTPFICPGINEAFAATISLYPNPAGSQVTVTTGQAGCTVYMYTAQGQLLSTQAMQGTAATLNTETLPSGIYYIEVSSSKGTARKKLVKL